MTLDMYPNDEDHRALGEAHELLATHGVTAGPRGYNVDTLAAAVYANGLSYRIDRAAGIGGYRVELRPQRGATTQPFVAAVGWEPEVALAFALAQAMMRRAVSTDRRPSAAIVTEQAPGGK